MPHSIVCGPVPAPEPRRRPPAPGAATIWLLAILALPPAGCAPREADYEVSERVRNAPQPMLAPTTTFDAPLAGGEAALVRVEAETEALAVRAAALRARGAAMSAAEVVAPADRDRLSDAARPEPELEPGPAPEEIPAEP